ncbi:unnamed protein product [Vitrella brassicaformis CCMP3155]|uniref:Major facilitator superfamily (MFS) profile domain-containing protein n=1 Tax=Vitrella brassicaformis (strain CCMP3155) TaxID=1169540 RepID=A0A0G4H2X4_VITBC|nr:unnamed protein product [Vitrella brassicaformis CCMP3155]|mmetsp:Transcript_47485/g.118655  ORF Transcript_47485/g.118655 Transcript_47485/m.118655 type:complete len:493 (-) Transcript_47485:632-2110(-)|eukprot:CEM38029.1 unnamed protein product [Vitrella brassicaformis CCMP3155]
MPRWHDPWFELRRWVPVIAGMVYCLTIGCMHCFGNITPYITSYMRTIGGEEVRYKDSHWIYSTAGISQGVFGFLGGILEQKVGPRIAAVVAGWIMSIGILASYFTMTSFYGLVLSYGVIFGIGCGLAYPIPLSVALKWHPDNKGLVSGLIFVARGLSVFLLTPLQTAFVNPLNLSPDFGPFPESSPKETYFTDTGVLERVPLLFLLMGALFVVMQAGSALFMGNPAEDDPDLAACLDVSRKKQQALTKGKGGGDAAAARAAVGQTIHPEDIPILPIHKMVFTYQFWTIWLIMFFNWQAISFVNGFWKIIGQTDMGLDDVTLALLGSVAAVTNSLGRVVWGMAGDRFGFKTTMMAICVSFWFFLITLPLCHTDTLALYGIVGMNTLVMYYIWINVIKIIDGGAFTIFPPVTSDIFGKRNFGPVFGLLFTARATSSLVGSSICSLLYDGKTVDLTGMCLLMSSCFIVSAVLTLSFKVSPIPVPPGYHPLRTRTR